MKKTILGISLMVLSDMLAAQTASVATVPPVVQQCVQSDARSIAALKWQQLSDNWWRASYLVGKQPFTKVCGYNNQEVSIALPVRETFIEPEVISNLIAKYGPEIYDITKVKGSDGQDLFVVRVLRQGQIRIEQTARL